MIHLLRVCVISVVPALRCSSSTLNQNTPKIPSQSIRACWPISTVTNPVPSLLWGAFHSRHVQGSRSWKCAKCRLSEKLTDRHYIPSPCSGKNLHSIRCASPPSLLPLAHRSCDFSLFQTAWAGAFVCSNTPRYSSYCFFCFFGWTCVPADRRTSATFLAGSWGGQQASAFRWNQSQNKKQKNKKKTFHSHHPHHPKKNCTKGIIAEETSRGNPPL